MKTIFRLDHLIIDCIVLLICLLSITLGCSGEEISNRANSGHISIRTEQEFWREWISKNDNSTCPLQPFVVNYNQLGIDQFEKRIENLSRTDWEMIFMRVNIDNGIYYYYYLSWNKGGQIASSLEWASPNDPIVEKSLNELDDGILSLLDKLSKKDVVTKIRGRKVLDGDSMYITLRHKGKYSRVAFYNPKIECKNQTRCDFPLLLLNKVFGNANEKEK